jgi:hypothetical protein
VFSISSLNALRPNATLAFSGARDDSRVNDEGGSTSLNSVIRRYHIPHPALEVFVRYVGVIVRLVDHLMSVSYGFSELD